MQLDEILEFSEAESNKWEEKSKNLLLQLYENGEMEKASQILSVHYSKSIVIYLNLWGGIFSPDLVINSKEEALFYCYLLEDLGYYLKDLINSLVNIIDNDMILSVEDGFIQDLIWQNNKKKKKHFLEDKLISALINYLIQIIRIE